MIDLISDMQNPRIKSYMSIAVNKLRYECNGMQSSLGKTGSYSTKSKLGRTTYFVQFITIWFVKTKSWIEKYLKLSQTKKWLAGSLRINIS